MRIAVVHALPHVSSAFSKDEDGFSAAMCEVAQTHDVDWVNIHPANDDWKEQRARITEADFALVRSDWGWFPDALAGPILARTNIPCALLIAGSHPPPSAWEALRYDALFYETPWYAQFIPPAPTAHLGLGINTSIMKPLGLDRDIDWLFVGRLASFKRPLRLLEKSGRRVAVGDFSHAEKAVRRALESGGVELVDHVDQASLANFYNRSHNVLVPCELQGGGERAVLEGQACGCNVEVAEDNPKLQSLIDTPIMSHTEYAHVFLDGINRVLEGDRTSRKQKLRGESLRQLRLLGGKVRRSPQTLGLRWRHLQQKLKEAQR